MKKILIIIIMIFVFTSCSKEIIEQDKVEKQDFFVETIKIGGFGGEYKIKKTGKIKSSQEIILSSKSFGRVSNINVKFGDEVYIGKNLINLADNISNYGLNLEKTNLAIESSQLNYQSTKISLDKNVSDLEINLEKVEKDYKNLVKILEENEKNSKLNLEQSKTSSGVITSSSIQLDKLVNTIKKSELDFENFKKSNKEQIIAFDTTSTNDFINLKNIYSDVINLGDGILGVTKLNKRKNDKFEDYLGLKDSMHLKSTQDELRGLIDYKLEKLSSIDGKNMEYIYKLGEEGYPKLINFLDNLYLVLDNSVENIYFSNTQISGYKSQISGFKTSASGNYTGFLNTKTSKDKFLNTYKDNEKSNLEQINLLKKDLELTRQNLKIGGENAQINYDKTVLNNNNSLNGLETSLKTAKLNLENSKKNRSITLKQLNNSIKLSQNTKNLASKEYSKLFISSPISGVVSEILVDKGQDVSNGTPLIKLSSLGKNEIEIGLTFSEIHFIKIGNKVEINYLGEKLIGSISAISKVADQNLNYKTRISIKSKVNISGNIVEVIIPVKIDKQLISLKNIKVESEAIAEINILENNEIKKELIKFGDFFGDKVEVLGCKDLDKTKCDNLEIITNDISNFDSEKFNIVKK